MAITTTSGLTLYDNCDTATFTGADGIDADEKIQGVACQASDVDIETNTMIGAAITSINMSTTKYAIYPFAKSFTAAYLDLKENGGLFGILSDGTNDSYWYVGGSDTYPGGWEVLSFNSDAAPDGNSGTAADLTAITNMGFGFKGLQKSKLADNSFLDYYRYASATTPALRIYGTNTVTNDLWSEVLSDDTALIAGVIKAQSGSYVLKGPVELGDSVGTTASTITDNGSVIVFDGGPVGDLHHAIIGKGNGTGATSITFTNQTILSAGGRFAFDQTDANLTSFSISGGSLTHAGAVSFKSGQTVSGVVFTDSLTTSIANTVTGSTFSLCGLITVTSTGALTDCIVTSGTGATAVLASTPAVAANITGATFTSDGTGNGLEITGTAADLTLTDAVFTGYSATVDADKAIYVNIASGTVNLTISGGSGVSLSSHVRTAGATVNIISGAITVKVSAALKDGTPVENALAYLRASDGTGPFPFEESVTISRTTTTATVTHTAHGMASNDKIILKGITDKTEDNFKVKQITVTDANTYTYTTTDSGSTSYTGTIVSTFVAITGLTSAAGSISLSRVYSSSQPVVGWTRKSTTSPLLQEGVLVGTISNTTGFDGTAVMLSDE